MSPDIYTQLLHQPSPHLSQHPVSLQQLYSAQSVQTFSVSQSNYHVGHWYAPSAAVSLNCSHLQQWLQFSQKLDCPCCYSHQLSTETIKTPNSVILGLFEKRQVPQQSQITVQAILDTPRTTPTNHVEKQVATSLVKRLLSESEGGVISIPTKGKVTYTVKWKSHMQNSICSQSL